MTEERKYIYSIISAECGSLAGWQAGAPGGKNPKETEAPNQSLRHGTGQASNGLHLSESVLGINNRGIIFIPYRDIAAVVSNIHLIDFDELDKKELAQFIAAHDQVNVGLMRRHDVIPMRFGMIAENAEEIRNILAKAYIQFKAALERISGKAEFIVQVFWNEKNILEKIVRENAEIQKLKKKAESKGRILGFSSKMKLGKLVFEAIESYRKKYVKDILDDLVNYFPNFTSGKLLDLAKTGVDEAGKEMIMNYSFLVGKAEESALEFQLNKLAEIYKNELRFKYIGPMAPYSFAVINLGVGNFDLVDTARRTFGLGELATFQELKDAYYKLAAEHHPDKHEYKKDQVVLEKAEKKMKDIITANEVLTVYCKHYLSALPAEKEQVCSFKKEDVERVVMVNAST